MSQVINTNIPSINAQRNLSRSGSELATALQRLSSGLRINSAKDDAAGLAISERFTTQIRGLNVAIRNANDGISLSQTAEGALAEVTNNLQRIRELAVQARNATNSASDRAALDAEVQQRLAEIDRTAAQTSFNGQKILDGSFGNATFQVGANAGETISLSLDSSMRLAELGQVSLATSGGIGADATGGSLTLGAISNFDFDGAGSADGGVTATASSFLFDTVADAGSQGTTTISQAQLGGDFDFSTANAQPGVNAQNVGAGLNNVGTGPNFSGTGNLAQFDVSDGTTTYGVTLTADYSASATAGDDIAADIQAQLGATVTVAYDNATGELTFTNASGTPANAVQILASDANATSFGVADSAGLAGAATEAFTFTVDGAPVTLNANYTDGPGVAAAIQGQLAGYVVNFNAGNYEIVNTNVGSTAPAIAATNAYASASGVEDANLTGVDGTPSISANSIEFVVDGTTITLDDVTAASFASFQDVADYIGTTLGAGYTVTADANAISIVNNDGVTPVAITASSDPTLAARAAAAGFGPQTGAFTGAATFEVDGQVVTLAGDYTDIDPDVQLANLAAAIGGQLTGYSVDVEAGSIVIRNDTLGSPAVVIANADGNATAAGIVDATGIAGSSEGEIELTAGQFTIAVPPSDTVDMQGTYASPQALADAINSNVSSVFAQINEDGTLSLMSPREFTIGGTAASTLLGFTPGTFTPTDGNLVGGNVLTAESADDMIVRVDAALTAVSGLRSNFGAIQNRFESTIANLQITSENLTASRSRILDADFAQETANLTRGQILQQAGTAILSQANQLPQNVLSLLR